MKKLVIYKINNDKLKRSERSSRSERDERPESKTPVPAHNVRLAWLQIKVQTAERYRRAQIGIPTSLVMRSPIFPCF